MTMVGKTPLLRAKQLEKVLNVGEIYIKLEGTNPSGHKNDRIAAIICKEALEKKQAYILAEGSEAFLKSMLFFSKEHGLEIKMPKFKQQNWKDKSFTDIDRLDFTSVKEDRVSFLKTYSLEQNAFLVIEGYTHTQISRIAYEKIGEEILERLQYDVDSFYTKLSFGYTVNSLYTALLKGWVNGDTYRFSNIVCATDQEAMGRLEANYLAHTIKCIEETDGEMLAVDETLVPKAMALLRKTEHLLFTKNEIMPFVAFYQKAIRNEIKTGRHVIILNNAKSEVKIDNIQDFDEMSKGKLVAYTREWLAQYSDSKEETQDAIENANEKGFILLASRNGEYEGICIIVNLGFEAFIPKYHLAYIGTKESGKGRGLATDMILKAIELTNGNLSLHVDIPNKKAKALYEKLGFKHAYNRMIFQK